MQKSLQKSQNEKPNQTGKLIAVVGQTASGKSALAVQLAQKFNGEIVCADSRTMYRGMDIGTAKPSTSDQKAVPHHLLDIVNPSEKISAHNFVQFAKKSLRDIWSREKVAIVVGGSGMYIDALLYDYTFREEEPTLHLGLSQLTLEGLQELAKKKYGDRISEENMRNPRRLLTIMQRGLAENSDRQNLFYDCLIIGLEVPDEVLKQRIAMRTQSMFAEGFIDEVRGLMARYSQAAPGLQATGYREVINGLAEHSMEATMIDQINTSTWQLARKQRTWFKRNPHIHWCTTVDQVESLCATYLAQ